MELQYLDLFLFILLLYVVSYLLDFNNMQFADHKVCYDYNFLSPDINFGLLEGQNLLDICFSQRVS